MINLISDTITKPSKAMLEAMMSAEVGDDVFETDITVNNFQNRLASLFGFEAALFCPSGTMANQIAIKVNTSPLDEMICDIDSHVYQFESSGFAFHSGISVHLIQGENGKIVPTQIESSIKPSHDWLPSSKLVVIENTCNKGGGSYYNQQEIEAIAALCKSKNLKLHIDGARVFNALVETNEDPKYFGTIADTMSVCMSKGLGAPVGSVLLGSHQSIKLARRYRKVMGGGMRQVGILAAACDYAISNNIGKLRIDNDRAKAIADILSNCSFVKSIKPVYTNILIFTLTDNIQPDTFLEVLKSNDILATKFGPKEIRFVFHMDISETMFQHLKTCLQSIKF